MNVAAVQFKARKGDFESSLRALVHLASDAALDADLVVLPEMAATGYLFADVQAARQVAEAPDGVTFQALSEVARQAGSWVVAGFPERDGDRVFNSAMVIDPSGQRVFTYRKTLLYTADLPWATPGDSGYRRFDTDEGSFGVGICMDLNDDRFLGWCRSASVDVIAMPTNWVEEDLDAWDYWAWRIQGGTLVAANTWGTERLGDTHTQFSGASAVISDNRLMAAAPKFGDGFITASLHG